MRNESMATHRAHKMRLASRLIEAGHSNSHREAGSS